MSPEFEQPPKFTVEVMTADDIVPANEMRLRSWLDTYVNDEAGVTREWIETRNYGQNNPDKIAIRTKRLDDPKHAGWVAKDEGGNVIGVTTPFVDEKGICHVGSLYVDKKWLGTGVGAALMQKVIDWSNPAMPIELEVVTYNERARAFYRKWGFEEILGTEAMFDGKIPEIKMIRKGDTQ